jgi:lipopolysaccharide export system permease protein
MRLEFFPSRTLTLYLAKLFAVRILAVLIMLIVVLQTLDLLGESGKILAVPGNGQADILRYVGFRTPQLLAMFLPYSVLLATIITLATLNQNSEVVSMKAAGLSAHQVLAPLFLVAAVIALASFAFNERVVTRSTATLKAWIAAEYKKVPPDSAVRTDVFLRDGPNILAIGQLSGNGAATRMERVDWYRRDASGKVVQQIRAARASFADPGWRLEEAVQFDVAGAMAQPIGSIVLAKGVTPAQVALGKIDPDAQDVFTLRQTIQAMKAAGRRTSEFEGKWWHKFAGPLATLLMPLLGAVAAFGLARSGQLLLRAAIGMALGFAYFVVDNAALSMGSFGGYPPMIAAWAPFLLFALIGETVLIRTEE